jgi:hypothetical protein
MGIESRIDERAVTEDQESQQLRAEMARMQRQVTAL